MELKKRKKKQLFLLVKCNKQFPEPSIFRMYKVDLCDAYEMLPPLFLQLLCIRVSSFLVSMLDLTDLGLYCYLMLLLVCFSHASFLSFANGEFCSVCIAYSTLLVVVVVQELFLIIKMMLGFCLSLYFVEVLCDLSHHINIMRLSEPN